MKNIPLLAFSACLLFLFDLSAQSDVLCVGMPTVDIIIHAASDTEIEGKGGCMLVDKATITTMLDLSPTGIDEITAGGSGANTIRALGKLGNQCAMIGTVGLDDYGALFIQALEDSHVRPLLQVHPHEPTQQVLCIISEDKQRTFRCCLGAAACFAPEQISGQEFHNAQFVHIEGYLLREPNIVFETCRYAKDTGALLSLDAGCYQIVANARDDLLNILQSGVHVFFANSDEAFALTGMEPYEACTYLQTLCPIAVILMGAEGCLVGANGKVEHHPGHQVEVVDTIAAGDYFAAGFVHGLLHQKPLSQCAAIGNLLGSSIVQIRGASLPEDSWQLIREKINLYDYQF